MKPRVYINLYSPQIEELAKIHRNDLGVLCDILHELKFRRSVAALHLKLRVAKRIIQIVRERKFVWPSVEAPESRNDLSSDVFQHANGVLSFIGYQVGKSSVLQVRHRRDLLDFVYLGDLPLVISEKYMSEWGKKKSSLRLNRLLKNRPQTGPKE